MTTAAYLKVLDGNVAARGFFQTTLSAIFFGRLIVPAKLTEIMDAGEVSVLMELIHMLKSENVCEQCCLASFLLHKTDPS